VTYKKSSTLIGLALAMSTAGYASRLAQDNSDYGNAGPDCTSGATPGFSCVLPTGLIGQDFSYSNNSNFDVDYQIFDFQVTATDLSNFTLTLTGTVPFAADQLFEPGDVQFYGYGTFACSDDDLIGSLCGPDTTDLVSVSPGTNDGGVSSVQFTVPGNGNGFTFYVAEDVGDVPDPIVTASIAPNTSPVPEPSSLPFLAAGVAVVALSRRRLAKLLQ
jgi:hypothetical protein